MDIECIRQVCSHESSNIVVVLFGAGSLAGSLAGQIRLAPTLGWLAAIVMIRLVTQRQAFRFADRLVTDRPLAPHAHLVSQLVEGTVWGSSVILLHPIEQRYEVFLMLALCTVSIIATLALSPYFRAALAFTIPINVLQIGFYGYRGGRWGWEVAAAVLAIYGITVVYARVVNVTFRTAVAARLEIATLAEELDAAKGRMEQTNVELLSRNDQLRDLASKDALTGLFNRRHFMDELGRMHRNAANTTAWYVAILDADHFKRINDQYGHQMGDEVLVAIGAAGSAQVRSGDCFARIGGEEFGLLLVDMTYQTAIGIVERIREAVAAIDAGSGSVTLSAGLIVGASDETIASNLGRADAALYAAKRAGRDQLVCC